MTRKDPATACTADVKLSDALRACAMWADEVPPHAQAQVAAAVDRLTLLLGQVVADAEDEDPPRL